MLEINKVIHKSSKLKSLFTFFFSYFLGSVLPKSLNQSKSALLFVVEVDFF